jgi:hypothetical protein
MLISKEREILAELNRLQTPRYLDNQRKFHYKNLILNDIPGA